jgi:hypothetical protein
MLIYFKSYIQNTQIVVNEFIFLRKFLRSGDPSLIATSESCFHLFITWRQSLTKI